MSVIEDIYVEFDDIDPAIVDVPDDDAFDVLIIQGADGRSMQPVGQRPTYAELPILTESDAGQVWVANGLAYIWDGAAWPPEEDGIPFQGPQGDQGRGVVSIGVSGGTLVFTMSETPTTEAVAVPAITAAQNAATAAQNSATAAAGSATSAASAKTAAEAARDTATTAATYAGTANTAAQSAKSAAESARDTAVTKAGEASGSAAAADASKTAAAGSASAASTSAGNAATSATSAGNANTAAQTAKADAQSARDAAQASATAAAASETNAAPTSRTVGAGTGLSGGGDLTANRTIALSAASQTSLGKADTAVQPARTIATGAGLSGGGDLSANRTIALTSGAQASLAKADTSVQQSATPMVLYGTDGAGEQGLSYLAYGPSGGDDEYTVPMRDENGRLQSAAGATGLDVVNRAQLDAAQLVAINAQTGTTYTLALADASKAVECSNASAITVTVPANSTVAFPVGTVIEIVQIGAGQITLAPGSGVTLQQAGGLKTRAQYSVVVLRKRATDTWIVAGDTAS